jgi:hypothetical protein
MTMKRIVAAALISAFAVGCASSAEIQSVAYEHLDRARYYEAQGDRYHADKERAAANKQFAKARRRAYEEAYYGAYWF